ncbi:MAG: hypothetical protein FWF03_02900 [Defluviitaleaceae bacterium]|nr:hypothetical protein [Defluviitaleaceae bacterium]
MSEIGETILNITRGAAKTSGDLLKTAKLSLSLSNEQKALDAIYLAIGKKVHEIYMYGGTLGKFFDEQYGEIVTCEQKIKELQEKIGAVKGTRACPKCGKSAEREAEFCPKCGLRMDEAAGRPADFGGAAMPDDFLPAPAQKTSPPEPLADADNKEDKPEINEPQKQAAAKKCGACGALNDAADRFCLTCGRII